MLNFTNVFIFKANKIIKTTLNAMTPNLQQSINETWDNDGQMPAELEQMIRPTLIQEFNQYRAELENAIETKRVEPIIVIPGQEPEDAEKSHMHTFEISKKNLRQFDTVITGCLNELRNIPKPR